MLVLSRRIRERIYVGDDVRITIVDIDRGKVRLGIEAPDGTTIYREEILPPEKAAHWREADQNG